MEGKYFFNNKDITMNLCIQIRDVIDIIKERSHLSFQDAAGAFYHSKTYQALQNTENSFGRSQRAISQTGSTKNRNKKNYRQTEDLSTLFKKGTTYRIGGSFFCAERNVHEIQ